MKRIFFLIFIFFNFSSFAGPTCSDLGSPLLSRFSGIVEDMKVFQTKTPEIKEYSDLRTLFFRMETLAKLYKQDAKKKNSKIFKKIHEEAKKWEDLMGKSLLLYDLWKADSFSESSKYFDDYHKSKEELDLSWQKSDWAEGKAQKDLYKQLGKVKWGDREKDLEFVISLITENITEVDQKLRGELKPLILREVYDYESLELGFHEMRRSIRWIALYFQNHKDLFFIEPISKLELNVKEKQLIETYKDNKYARLGAPSEGKIGISALAFYEMSYFIDQIGRIKDAGEKEYYLTDNFKNRKKAGNLENQAHEIYNEYLESGFMQSLLRSLSK